MYRVIVLNVYIGITFCLRFFFFVISILIIMLEEMFVKDLNSSKIDKFVNLFN